jgi:hypothetical protein
MAFARTPRERLLWRLFVGLVLAIYAAAYFVQFAMLALRSRGLLGPTVRAAFLGCGAAALYWLLRQRPGPAELLLYAVGALLYLAMIRHLDIIQERIHLLEYGTVAAFAWGALRERWGEGSGWKQPALGALLLTTAAGWGDELVQAVLPNRVYDLRDVLTNAIAGALFLFVAEGRARLRARAAAVASAR